MRAWACVCACVCDFVLAFTENFSHSHLKGNSHQNVKGEVHPKMITSYLVVFGALSRMVKIGGAYDKPFWIYKRLNN